MAPAAAASSPVQFIDTALWCATDFALSYTDPDQKWLIRKHLLSLLQNNPSFNLSNDTFIHNDGATVNLFNVSGYLHVSQSTLPIHFTIWLHENYPSMAPMVIVSPPNPAYPIRQNHPFVTPCGKIITPYLQIWSYPGGSNLNGLVRNLAKIFSHDHPFFCYSTESSFTHPSLVSKREGLDRLSGMLHYDTAALKAKTEEETEDLLFLQAELRNRAGVIRDVVSGLEHERNKLKERVTVLDERADVLMNWLRVNDDPKATGVILLGDQVEDAFEAIDEESKAVIDVSSADEAIEDVMYALEKALEQGAVSFDIYIRQVRILAREQFFHRDKLVNVEVNRGFTR